MGTFAISGSVATRLRNRVMACAPSIRSVSMFTSIRLAPFSTWSRATSTAAWKSPDSIKRANRFEPVLFVRSPTITNRVWGVIRMGSSPEKEVKSSRVGRDRGAASATAALIARMWSGVVPQQPPTRLTSPAAANSPSSALVISGVSSKPPKAFGRPALG